MFTTPLLPIKQGLSKNTHASVGMNILFYLHLNELGRGNDRFIAPWRLTIVVWRPSYFHHLIPFMRVNLQIAWTAPSHYMNQCWNIVNWTPRNKLQWNVNQNSNIFIRENPFENVAGNGGHFVSASMCKGARHIWASLQLTVWNKIPHDWFVKL